MSTGHILLRVRDHLRSTLSLDTDQCEIRCEGNPTSVAGQFFIGVREMGVQGEGKSFLRELSRIEVAVWRRASDVPHDRSGDLHLSSDPWLSAVFALDEMERQVIRAIHGNHADLPKWLNNSLSLGEAPQGDRFLLPLFYEGRSGTEALSNKKERPAAWYGRRLQFAGMTRVQSPDVLQ